MKTPPCRGRSLLIVTTFLSFVATHHYLLAQELGGTAESVAKTLKLLKAPQSPAEYWDAVKFSLNVGRSEDAANYLDRLLSSDPPTDLLLTIRERDAATYFPKLSATPELQSKAIELLKLTERAAHDRARDPQRIQMFINYLVRSPQHRAYGIMQLRSAGADAVPYLLGALRDPAYVENRATILQAMQKLDASALPPLLAALGSGEMTLVADILYVLRAIGNQESVPHLLYLAAASQVPPAIQSQARRSIEDILHVRYSELPAAVEAITAQARRYYEHQVDLGPSAAGTVRLWRWVGNEGLKSQEVTPGYAEEYFGLELCRQALGLEPAFEPAQILLLSLALQKASDRVGIDQRLPEGSGSASAAAVAAGAPILAKVLSGALNEGRPNVAVGALRSMAAVGDAKLLTEESGSQSPLVRALAAGEWRIQFAAAEAVLSIHPQHPMAGTSLIVPILTRALSGDTEPKALVIDRNPVRGAELTSLVREAGYQAEHVTNAREGFALIAKSSSYELIFLDPNISDPELSPTIVSLRSDPRTASVPILILGNWDGTEPTDPLFDSLSRSDVSQAIELLRGFGEQVAGSKLDVTDKEAIQKQIVDSARVLERYASNRTLAPPSRVFMTTLEVELGRIVRETKLTKSEAEERSRLLGNLEILTGRVRRVANQLAGGKTIPVKFTSYPGTMILSKFERSYPRVKVLVRPNSLEMLQVQLVPYIAGLQSKPLSAGERADYARRAVQGLARIARGEVPGIDVRPAEAAVLAILNHEVLGPDAMVVAGRIRSEKSQSALAQFALNGSGNAALRLDATRQLAESLRAFGKLLSSNEAASLETLLDQTSEPALYQALAAVVGAMKPGAAEVGKRLRQLPTPPFSPPRAPQEGDVPPPPKPAPQAEPDKPEAL